MAAGAESLLERARSIPVTRKLREESGGRPGRKQSLPKKQRDKFRSVFISDLHFGSSAELASHVADFLDSIKRPKYLILAGDILDFWSFAKKLISACKVFSQNEFIVYEKIRDFIGKGSQVFYVPGNHDSFLRTFIHPLSRLHNRNFHMVREVVHETKDNRHFLVCHGDEFDAVVTKLQWLGQTATRLFDGMVHAGNKLDALRNASPIAKKIADDLGLPTAHSTMNGIKARFDRATRTPDYQRKQIEFLFAYNAAVFAQRQQHPDAPAPFYFDGLIGGHTHCAGLWSVHSPVDPKTSVSMGPEKLFVYDIGHWTGAYQEGQDPPSCTALIEHLDGKLELMRRSPSESRMVPLNALEQTMDHLVRPVASSSPPAPSVFRRKSASPVLP